MQDLKQSPIPLTTQLYILTSTGIKKILHYISMKQNQITHSQNYAKIKQFCVYNRGFFVGVGAVCVAFVFAQAAKNAQMKSNECSVQILSQNQASCDQNQKDDTLLTDRQINVEKQQQTPLKIHKKIKKNKNYTDYSDQQQYQYTPHDYDILAKQRQSTQAPTPKQVYTRIHTEPSPYYTNKNRFKKLLSDQFSKKQYQRQDKVFYQVYNVYKIAQVQQR